MVSTEVQGAPAPMISDKGEQGKAIQVAPGEAEVQKSGEKEPGLVENLSLLRKSRPHAPAHPCKHQNESRCKKKEEDRPSTSKTAPQPAAASSLATAAVDDDSSSTTVDDSEMDARSQASCDLCKSVACDCSELSGTSYLSIPFSPIAGEPVA
ncbi:hypothetical protein MRX96_017436 [Rhipicephalus microplus]